MVWGTFSPAGTGELLHCEKSINALEYRIILQKGLLSTSCFLKQNNQMLFFNWTILLPTLQRPPKCDLVTSPSSSCFGQSPDLNPKENIWSHIKLTRKHFSTTHQLFVTVNIELNNIDSSFCKKLSTSLPTTLKHFKSKGKSIQYQLYLFNSCLFPDH